MSTKTMPESVTSLETETLDIELRDPLLAAFLAWLVPGGGHLYQGRTAKGILFMVCILGTFFYGFYLGGGRVVYAAWGPEDRRWAYPCQLGAGLPALPALVQAQRVRTGRGPLWGGFMAPPRDGQELQNWHFQHNRFFDLGTTYTMIAGLLNVLAIYDAYAGPMIIIPQQRKRKPRERPKQDHRKRGDEDAQDNSPDTNSPDTGADT
jgi:hypothetical protein